MKKVLIADHHPVIRKGVMCMLKKSKDFEICGKAQNGDELWRQLESGQPDIVVMELELPQVNGISALRNIKAKYPQTRILVFSHLPEEIYALRSIKSGAAGYVPKSASTKIFIKALKQLSRGGIFLNEELNETFTQRNVGESSAINRYKKLSSREIEVLNLLSNGKRNKDIAHALDINEKTVSTYKTRLLKKLKVDNIADLINQARMFRMS
ncbi:MAG: response regulator transcription factor [Flavobacteriaceae bacterium]|nr:response regulator transcription factor [Flavobacteriaceae bacterium]MDG1962183.1 response regulator transcription factor [Flavobacteriaceae bacterium]